jgi:hypothetical protein
VSQVDFGSVAFQLRQILGDTIPQQSTFRELVAFLALVPLPTLYLVLPTCLYPLVLVLSILYGIHEGDRKETDILLRYLSGRGATWVF